MRFKFLILRKEPEMSLINKNPELAELVTLFESFPLSQRKSILKELRFKKARKIAQNLDRRKAKGKKLSEEEIMRAIIKIRKASQNG